MSSEGAENSTELTGVATALGNLPNVDERSVRESIVVVKVKEESSSPREKMSEFQKIRNQGKRECSIRKECAYLLLNTNCIPILARSSHSNLREASSLIHKISLKCKYTNIKAFRAIVQFSRLRC